MQIIGYTSNLLTCKWVTSREARKHIEWDILYVTVGTQPEIIIGLDR